MGRPALVSSGGGWEPFPMATYTATINVDATLLAYERVATAE